MRFFLNKKEGKRRKRKREREEKGKKGRREKRERRKEDNKSRLQRVLIFCTIKLLHKQFTVQLTYSLLEKPSRYGWTRKWQEEIES